VHVSDDARFGPGTPAVRRFLAAIASLTFDQWREVIRAWRTTVTDAWHDADAAVASAVAVSERRQEREDLLSELGDITRRTRWHGGDATGQSALAIESSAHYVASLAALALLVRDHLSRHHFDALYRPFNEVVPLTRLDSVT
jgi:hypothetical protein